MAKSKNKTPLRYFTQKQKAFKSQFIADYLGTMTSSSEQSSLTKKNFNFGKPIIPFQPFIVKMPFNLVLAVNDGDISMIELIKIPKSQKTANDLWFILESTYSGLQYLGLPDNVEAAREIQKIATLLNIPTYPANLAVTEDADENSHFVTAKYERKNPLQNKKIKFKAKIPKSLASLDGQISSNLIPNKNKRLSHGMNHSASSVMALIDIYQTPDFLQLPKIEVNFNQDSDIKLQKILGLKVKSPIAQLVIGFGSREYQESQRQKEINQIGEALFEQKLSDNMGRIEYQFEEDSHNRMGLREIRLFPPNAKSPQGKIVFNPTLPDLRYKLAAGIHRVKIAMALEGTGISNDLLHAYIGEVRLQNSQTGNGIMLEIRSGNMDDSHRKRFKKTSEWTYKRPIYSLLELTADKQDLIAWTGTLAPAPRQIFSYKTGLKELTNLQTVQAAKINWHIRPHRLSRLVIRTSDKKILEENQLPVDPTSSTQAPAYMLGGTWGNGQAAADKTTAIIDQGLIESNPQIKLYQANLPMFPMRHFIGDYAETNKYFSGEKAEIATLIHLIIKLPEDLQHSTLIPFINGIKFQSAANHFETAVTFNSLSFKIYSSEEAKTNFQRPSMELDEAGQYHLLLEIKKGYGPELTRPYKGPLRQNLESYAGYGAIDLGLISSTISAPGQPFKVLGTDKKPVRFSLPGKGELPTPKFGQRTVTPQYFPTALEIQSIAPNSQKRASRYIRSLQLSLPMDQSPQESWYFGMDNLGEISWKTEYKWTIEGIKSNLFK